MVLHAPLTENLQPHRERELMVGLAYAKRLELEAREPASRTASLAALSLVLEGTAALTGREATVSELSFPLGGKPHFTGNGPGFSISHCEGCVVVAVSADSDPGIDVEVASGGRMRLARWVATEAVLKAGGAGLRSAAEVKLDEENRTGFLRGLRYRLYELELGPGFVGALASREPVTHIEYRATSIA